MGTKIVETDDPRWIGSEKKNGTRLAHPRLMQRSGLWIQSPPR